MLAELSPSGLHLYSVNGAYVLSIENTTTDHRCLYLDNVTVTVDGLPHKVTTPGGGSGGRPHGIFRVPDENVLCESALVALGRDDDVLKKSDHIEVTDGTTTWTMDVPHVLVTPSWVVPPPAVVHQSASFTVRIAPDFPRGSASADLPTLVMASLDDNPIGPGLSLHAVLQTDGSISIDVPATATIGNHSLSVSSQQDSLKPTSCGASYCTASSDFRITAPIAIAP